ncbi:hypothetical protein [Legionella cincinnatiensis]|uniref:Uncharacterized protein n=1 Tax=Legionella cincinnatiensis TaxID=28085 RepID=A0A378IE65_9GAMM|nr:hypothetical protein [Legionella cincinnatiensis]KTC92177.1 hypothetical protein Lcin_0956 [Legionella cincinnatiensis]STX33518.1 Uncharacterised protein [Legionella cincinnatiensis]
MPNLSQKFRKSFISYLKNPHSAKNKETFVRCAFAIYEDAVTHCGLEPDKYISYMFEMIKPAVQGIKISPDTAKTLDGFIRTLSFSDLKKENQAFHVLNISYNLISPKKSCLREVMSNLLILQDKLKQEDFIVTNRKFSGSFFLSNSDVSNVRGKKSVIDDLIMLVAHEVFKASKEAGGKFFPVSFDVKQKTQYIEKHIDWLSEKECGQILHRLLQKINPILSAQGNSADIRDHAEYMTDAGKRSALMIHSFNDKWFFTFLAKMVKTIKEALGMKTSAEHLLENSVDEAEKVGVTLK